MKALLAVALALEPALGGRKFDKPVFMAVPPDGSRRRFVVEQGGRILAVDDAGKGGVFLDLSDRTRASGEKGLLGLAFHPRFRENGFLYVYYSAKAPRGSDANHESILARFKADGAKADPRSEAIVLRVLQPYSNHNGGCILFGPDGSLYVGLGDGGSGGDPQGNGQRLDTLLGKMLRLDVDAPGKPYAVPRDNPLVGKSGTRGEIWAWGLRNPWRFSFDRETGRLWAGDVGQNEAEEVDLIEKGKNYGWNLFEGTRPFRGKADPARFAMPAAEYAQGQAGRSITGGYVYRGRRFPSLRGTYLYGDYVSGRIRGFRVGGSRAAGDGELLAAGVPISSFAEDEAGELYVVSHDGPIFRIVAR